MGCTPPVGGVPVYGYPGQFAPSPFVQTQPLRTQPPPTQWQASGVPTQPAIVRGVAPEAPAAPPKYVLPRPEALGVSTSLNLQPAAAPPVDWTQIQTRMERVGVVGYDKDRSTPGSVRVTLTLRTADPARRQPVTAQGDTEAAAVLLALQHAEAWVQKR
jgi:hypothetical protein